MFCRKFLSAFAVTLAAALVSACGGGGSGASTGVVAVTPSAPNVLPVAVTTGPPGSGYNVNRLYASVRVCVPGSTACQTIDHVLVDTGSIGLRLLASALSPTLQLPQLTVASGLPLLNCVRFVDNSLAWGPVATADVELGGRLAANVPIQVVADPDFNGLVGNCSGGGAVLDTVASLGANGILGLGLFKEDCGAQCVNFAANDVYFRCETAACTTAVGSRVALSQQVKNPVPLFSSDNNGFLIDLPAVSTTARRLDGSLIFGVGTQPNNQPAGANVLRTTRDGFMTTMLAGQTLPDSFIDSGANALFFDSPSLRGCAAAAPGFYCPPARVSLSATLVAANNASLTVPFVVDDALSLFASTNPVLLTLAGDIGLSQTFAWGLPFFYGRRVFFGIEGQSSNLAVGPFYAF